MIVVAVFVTVAVCVCVGVLVTVAVAHPLTFVTSVAELGVVLGDVMFAVLMIGESAHVTLAFTVTVTPMVTVVLAGMNPKQVMVWPDELQLKLFGGLMAFSVTVDGSVSVTVKLSAVLALVVMLIL
jgi:hypothetical protein